jgi:ABC-type multidrug transport system fused ATPase/permease subunit
LRTFWRSLLDYRALWRAWLGLLVLSVLLPPIAVAVPLVERELIDGVILRQRLDLLAPTLALYAGLFLASFGLQVVGGPLRSYVGERLLLHLRRRLFAHCEGLSIAFARREHTGRTMALFVNDAPIASGLASGTVLGVLSSVLTLALGVTVMLSLSWQLALAAGILPPLVIATAGYITRPLRPAARRAQEKAAELNERLQESLSGMREIVAFGRERSQEQRLGTTLNELLRLRMRLALIDTAIGTGQGLFGLSITLVIVGYGGYLVVQGQTTLGTLIAMRTLFSYVVGPAGQLFGLVSNVQKSLASADRVYAFLDERPRVEERPQASQPRHLSGSVRFEDVSFAYHANEPVLKDISFEATEGDVIALVGPSGAGKSTLVSLLARFYDPTSGRVVVGGVDVRDVTLAALRRQIGMVFQDTFLFATTIRENIAFGREGASEEEIAAAARAAHAWEFIERLPRGLDTQVGERGVQFSEGQKQRLAIARALLRDPRILILDEPTSALDARSEHVLQSALENLMRGRTTFVIAHRLATVQRADWILAIEDGRVVEQGTHAELLQNGGLYAELFRLQFGGAATSPSTIEPLLVAARVN